MGGIVKSFPPFPASTANSAPVGSVPVVKKPSPIEVRGASSHNLRAVHVEVPGEALVLFTGRSGSGKSSLAYDTIYREAERRFLRSFSPYARRFVGRLGRPEVEEVAGLRPAISLDQKSGIPGARSTVGTMSGLYDFLRLLFGRVGRESRPGSLGACRLEARLFSFNSEGGACPSCRGLGVEDRVDPELLVADPARTLREGALVPTTPNGYIVYSQVTVDVLDRVCRAHDFSVDVPWRELTDEQRAVVLYGSDRIRVPFGKHPLESRMRWSGITARPREEGTYQGIVPTIEGILRVKRNGNALRFARSRPCATCDGTRLRAEARSVTVGDEPIAALAGRPLVDLRAFLQALALEGNEGTIAAPVIEAIHARIAVLEELGLAHLRLARPASGLSGGEINRLRLATQLVGGLCGVLYVLDEPSGGLHPVDGARLLAVLQRLRARGNSVLVVEHDEALVRAADWIVDLGPGAGPHGGEVLFSGPLPQLLENPGENDPRARSVTRAFLTGEDAPEGRETRRGAAGDTAPALEVLGARAHNLRAIDVPFLTGAFNVVSGVSGAGKTTLVEHVLGREMRRRLHGATEIPGEHARLRGAEGFTKVVVVDQNPIGRTPRSNPATYTKLFDAVRGLFAAEPEARRRGFDKGRFSFNVKGGRCERCEGAGVELVGMHYLPDAVVTCPECEGRRFNDETLAVRYRGRTIHDVLAMPFEEAREFLPKRGAAGRITAAGDDVGLGYLALGQPSPTLSGGEAQRVKLAAELARPAKGPTLYLLDEFTPGLHRADVKRVLGVLDRLVDEGHTVVAVEHDLDVLAAADRIVDLGPGAGEEGGRVVAIGTPEEVAKREESLTGVALRRYFDGAPVPLDAEPAPEPARPTPEIHLHGVRTHNLKGVDVVIPRDAITVITGPSGSGKSSLAFDTLHAEGHRRFSEGLSAYARRHLERMPRGEFDHVHGLGATIAVGQSPLFRNPRSTVATLTEIHDGLRLLYSRAGGSELSMRAFSFNHEEGACPACRGLGTTTGCDPERLVSHPERSLCAGALDGSKTGRFYGEEEGQYVATLRAAGEAKGIDFSRPWHQLDERARAVAMHGTGEREYVVRWRYRRKQREGTHEFRGAWIGFAGLVDEEYARTHADRRGEAMRPLLTDRECEACGGRRLGAEALAVRYRGLDIAELSRLSVARAREFLEEEEGLSSRARSLALEARREVLRRLRALVEVGLGYLPLDRRTDSLSGGEARRARLATQVGAGLQGVTYVLDEPTIGLHARDTAALIETLRSLRDAGNTVVVVEHDPDVIGAADHLIDLGPGAGARGGEVIAAGAREAVLNHPDSPTARALREGGAFVERPPRALGAPIGIRGAHARNLHDLDVELPTGGVVVVTGVSGSGKSTLVFDVLLASLERPGAARAIGCREIRGAEHFAAVVPIDQSPIGTGPHSTPATYLDLFGELRKVFAATDEAKRLRLTARALSLTQKGARCEACRGQGESKVEMGFLADVWVTCEMCGGARYGADALRVRYRGRNLAEVLRGTVAEAAETFRDEGKIAKPLGTLIELGLGYLRLGQSSPTLSGGESQRLRLAARLARGGRPGRGKGPSLYLLDEPTVGLHLDEVAILDALLHRLADEGNSVVVVEHHLDLIRRADWIVDLGPEGGERGGRVVACGHPAEISTCAGSLTGAALRR